MRICHLTSAHRRDDVRIFQKMCSSLSQEGYDVLLCVADGLADEKDADVQVQDVGAPSSRLERFFIIPIKLWLVARKIEAGLFHLHDPELIPLGLVLRLTGKRVVLDVHEDTPKAILNRPYLTKTLRQVVAFLYKGLASFSYGKFDGLIAATPHISGTISGSAKKASIVNNYPIIREPLFDRQVNEMKVGYVGSIDEHRGIYPLVKSLSETKNQVRLELIGDFSERHVLSDLEKTEEWRLVNHRGFLSRNDAREILSGCQVGIVNYLPIENHIAAQPNKLFEYMELGLPLICSNFDLWREMIDQHECGICVDPTDPQEIACAIDRLMESPSLALEMGKNARRACENFYSWQNEKLKLLDFYRSILS